MYFSSVASEWVWPRRPPPATEGSGSPSCEKTRSVRINAEGCTASGRGRRGRANDPRFSAPRRSVHAGQCTDPRSVRPSTYSGRLQDITLGALHRPAGQGECVLKRCSPLTDRASSQSRRQSAINGWTGLSRQRLSRESHSTGVILCPWPTEDWSSSPQGIFISSVAVVRRRNIMGWRGHRAAGRDTSLSSLASLA